MINEYLRYHLFSFTRDSAEIIHMAWHGSTCEPTCTWTFSGRDFTSSDGWTDIHLNSYLDGFFENVLNDKLSKTLLSKTFPFQLATHFIGRKPNFTATAESDKPVFLTCTVTESNAPWPHVPVGSLGFESQPLDVTIKVRSWALDEEKGTIVPAPEVSFHWIAIARTASIYSPTRPEGALLPY